MDKSTIAVGNHVELHPGAKKFYQEIGAALE
jgi:TRAP-type uncharacterized transport system substrate-binding protein